MKLRRRAVDEAETPLDLPSPPPTPPRGAAEATYAAVPDGRTLWLAVRVAPGALALRDRAGGDPVPLATDLLDDQPDHRSVRVDLATLGTAAAGEGSFDVVLLPPGGKAARRVWSPPLPRTRVPSVDGHRWEVRRDDDGFISLHRHAVDDAVELAGMSVEPEGVRLTVSPDAPLVLRGQDGAVLATLDDGLVTAAAADGVAPQVTRVTTGDGRPVVRRDDTLLNPGRSAPLPDVHLPGASVREPLGPERLRLRWTDAGLVVTVLELPEDAS